MIALIGAASAAIALPFAPPLDGDLAYRTVQVRPIRSGGSATVTLDQALRFARAGAALEASLAQTRFAIDAPEPARTLLTLLFADFDKVAIHARLDKDGAITGVIDGLATWEAIRRAQATMLARLQADPNRAPEEKARAATLSAGTFDLAPEARDARLADGLAALLAPPLPALVPGETRAFATELRSPAGTLAARGTVTLVAVSNATLEYRIESRAEAGAIDPAIAGRLALLAAPGGQAPDLAGAVYLERTRLEVERAMGLVLSSHTERVMVDAAGGEHQLEQLDQQLLTVS